MERTCPTCGKPHGGRYHRCHDCRADDVNYPGLRACGKCGERKRPSSFGRSKNAASWCLDCCRANALAWRRANTERARAYDAERVERHRTPEARAWHRLYRLLARYGISVADFDAIMVAQGGGCAICGRTPDDAPGRWSRLNIDHDHKTGKVRGVLCHGCNSGIGHLQDDPALLRRAAEYVEAHGAHVDAAIAAATDGVLTDC